METTVVMLRLLLSVLAIEARAGVEVVVRVGGPGRDRRLIF